MSMTPQERAVAEDPYLPIRRSTALIIATSMLLFIITCLTAVILSRQSVGTANDAVKAVSEVNAVFREETTCRAKYAAAVDVGRGNLIIAQTQLDLAAADYSAAFNDLIQLLLIPSSDRTPGAIEPVQQRMNEATVATQQAQSAVAAAAEAFQVAVDARATSVEECMLEDAEPISIPPTTE